MNGADKNSNRLNEIQGSNDFRSTIENNDRNTSNLTGANRPQGSSLSSSPKRTSITDMSPMDSIKSMFKGGNDGSTFNDNSGFRSKSSNGTFGFPFQSLPKNQQLTPKQQLTKKGVQMAATALNPAVGAALKSKTGERLANALVQRKNIISPSLGIAPIIPTAVKPEDRDKINEQGEKEENRFGSVSVKLSKKVKRILIPVVCSSAGVAFICCIIIVAAYSFVSLLGVDLSSQISMDDAAIKGAMEQGDELILEKLSNADGTNVSGNSQKSSSVGDSAKYTTQDERIKWLYDGKGVPQSKKVSDSYTETYEVEVIDRDGKEAKLEVTTHAKLKADVQEIFREMKAEGFKIYAVYSIRDIQNISNGPFAWSAHTYGHAIDINADDNPCYGCAGYIPVNQYNPGVNEYSVTDKIVNIWKKHGFYWGGDWVAPKDYMHFSYFNH